jgi:hypothetical protein
MRMFGTQKYHLREDNFRPGSLSSMTSAIDRTLSIEGRGFRILSAQPLPTPDLQYTR